MDNVSEEELEIEIPEKLHFLVTESTIYAIENLSDGKVYVGSATRYKIRWRDHLSYLKSGKHHNILLQRAWIKHWDNFKFKILEFVSDKSKLPERETYWIQKLNAFDKKFGYNILVTGGSRYGMKNSEVHNEKISNALKGINRSEETKRRMSQAKKGHSVSEETRRKISLNSKGNIPPNRDISKWPHSGGCKCKCNDCRKKRKIVKRNWEDARKLTSLEILNV